MNQIIFLFGIFFCVEVFAQDYVVSSGKLTYTIDHLLKKAQGTSKEVKGKIACKSQKQDCEFLVAVPVKSFTSGNSNRDGHMLETAKEAQYPLLSASGYIEELSNIFTIKEVAVNFAGKEISYPNVKINSQNKGSDACVLGTFPLVLTRHQIELPSLLGASIKDQVPVDFELCFKPL